MSDYGNVWLWGNRNLLNGRCYILVSCLVWSIVRLIGVITSYLTIRMNSYDVRYRGKLGSFGGGGFFLQEKASCPRSADRFQLSLLDFKLRGGETITRDVPIAYRPPNFLV